MKLADNRLKELDNPSLTPEGRILLRCRFAAEFIHTGQYESAREALGELWRGIGQRPQVEGLEETTAAEVLLQCGSLTGWLGASKTGEGVQDEAKDLISEARRLFEARGLQTNAAEAEYELGVCYWRTGAFDEARIVLRQAIERLGGNDVERKAKILIRSTVIEISAGRYHDALQILKEAEQDFQTASDAVRGRWHAQMALVLRRLGTAEGHTDYFDRAIIEYIAAIFHFGRARHERYCANNENNLAFLLYKLGRYDEAHEHLDRAQKIFTRLSDAGSVAQVRETQSRVLLAEKRYKKATEVISGAVGTLEKVGEPALLSDALTVQATIHARLGHHYLSLPAFRRAVKVAEDAGAVENAGLAALSMIEEHGAARMSEAEVYAAYRRADALLKHTQDAEAIARLRACARIVTQRLAGEKRGATLSFPEAVQAYEARLIKQALKDAKGSITQAAKRLGISYQWLSYLLETRHKDLQPARMPPVKRKRSIIKKKT
jgi:tetratricopeptide (TPR) repeat protein